MGSNIRTPLQIAVFFIACAFVIYGFARGEAGVVLHKAVNICLECIGLG